MTRICKGVVAALCAAFLGGPAAALSSGLLGETITLENLTAGGTETFLVSDPGVELDGSLGAVGELGATDLFGDESVDFLDLSIIFTITGGLQNRLKISGYSGTVESVVGASTGGTGDPADGLTTIAADGTFFIIEPIFGGGGGSVEYTLTFADDGGGIGAVPLPAPALMLLTGLAVLGLARRRKA